MKKAGTAFVVIASLILFSKCAPARFVKALEKNKKAASFSFGGPLILFGGSSIPIPFSTLAYGYGLADKVTVFGSLHTTSLLFGNLQSDLGATFRLYEKANDFGLTITPALQVAYNLRNTTGFRVWPTIDLNSYFHFKERKSYMYAGVNAWFEFSKMRAHQQPQPQQVIPNFHLGYTVVKTKWQHQFELKYLGATITNLPNVVDYVGLNKRGSLGIYYSIIKPF